MGALKAAMTAIGGSQAESEEQRRARLAESAQSGQPTQKKNRLANMIAGLQGSNPSLMTVDTEEKVSKPSLLG